MDHASKLFPNHTTLKGDKRAASNSQHSKTGLVVNYALYRDMLVIATNGAAFWTSLEIHDAYLSNSPCTNYSGRK